MVNKLNVTNNTIQDCPSCKLFIINVVFENVLLKMFAPEGITIYLAHIFFFVCVPNLVVPSQINS